MSEVCINVLVGLPGAGKTTFCQKFQNFLHEKRSQITLIHVCFDNFLKIAFDCENFFKMQRKQFMECVELLVDAVRKKDQISLDQVNEKLIEKFGTNVPVNLSSAMYLLVLDDNMYYRSMRFDIYKIARRYQTGYFQTYFDIPLEEAMARNASRSTPIPDDVVMRMNFRLEKPCAQFYRWEKNSIATRNPLLDFDRIEKMAIDRMNHREIFVTCKVAIPVVEQSIIHRLDLLLRKSIGEIIKGKKNAASPETMKAIADELNSKRKAILSDFKAGLVEIPDPHSVDVDHIKMLF
ncbi:L-seryl-tRNA(Sec) kinase [Topomyia yanbarensis]|uniref:L-seryl-tRNA(Sec) kinase n=1 Tax=Topomyia yanbarensis TaxID=2498891 RepID=UPI00273CA895|nr:L-seryl-tRNA(Sec) kinase [Topomyia yanbarensis]